MRLHWIMAVGLVGCGGEAVLGENEVAGAPASGGSASTAPEPVDGSACSVSGALAFGAPSAADDDGDGLFEPGERVHVGRWVENTDSTEHVARLQATADDPRVAPENAGVVTLPVAPGARVLLRETFVVPVEVWSGSEVGFTLTGSSVACDTPSAGELEVTVSNYAWDLDTCPMTRQLVLADPTLIDAGGDGALQPGEDGSLQVRMSNPGPLDHDWYPGIEVIAHDPRVSAVTADGWRYAMSAGTTDVMQLSFHVDASVPSGTELRFTLRPAALHVHCRNVAGLEYSFLVQ